MRPVRAKALIINAFALAGRFAIFNPYTQGAALGYVLLGLSARFVDFWHTIFAFILAPQKLKIEQFKMRVAHNSKLKTQNSKLPSPPTRQHKPTATATEEFYT